MSEEEFILLIEKKALESKELKDFNTIKDLVSTRFRVYSYLDLVSLVLLGAMSVIGYYEHSTLSFSIALIFSILSLIFLCYLLCYTIT